MRILETIAEDEKLDRDATAGPWHVWDGPEYYGGGKDLCIGAWDGQWLANMDHRIGTDLESRIAHDSGNTHQGRPGSCPICSISENITEEQAANVRFIVEARTRWPERTRQLKEILTRHVKIGTAARETVLRLREGGNSLTIEERYRMVRELLDDIWGGLDYLLPSIHPEDDEDDI